MKGQPIPRVDGALKVTGRARYSLDRDEPGRAVHGVIVGASIGRGRLERIDTTAAEKAPGVLLVMTRRNAPEQGAHDVGVANQFFRARPVFTSDRVESFGQPVALVVAETFEQARAAAALVAPTYSKEQGAYTLADGVSYVPKMANAGFASETTMGDFDRAFAQATTQIEQTYRTPHHFAQPMEPHSCVAQWRGDDLHVWAGIQTLQYNRRALAATLKIREEEVHLDAAFVGGGFGSKLKTHAELVCAALAARLLGRAVQVALTRRQTFTLVGGRPETIQRVRLGADADGRLTAISHEVTMQGSSREEFVEQTATVTRSLYAAPHRLTRHSVVTLDRFPGEPVRGPGELPGLLAVETAMDELAHALQLDPVELRLRNDTRIDPERNVPLSSHRLADCLREGARRFNWANRPTRPRTRRDGHWLIGYGMASAIRIHFQGATKAAVRMTPDGRVEVATDMTDIGTGTYTVLAQVAAEALGVPLRRVRVVLARTDLPQSSGSGGSWGAANASMAVHRACMALREKVIATAATPAQARNLQAAVALHFPEGVRAEGAIVGQRDEPAYKQFSQHTYGATFAEVGVDVYTGEVRMRRMLGVFAAGRILNPMTARSQLIGGMVWGLSSALLEAAHIDSRDGHVVNGDLAEYLLPVNADVPDIDAVLLDDIDTAANPLGIKGVGELGVCGSGAAVSNAVFNATGIRVREFPMTLESLLSSGVFDRRT
jgi:xanthine dehydrogenase YagR molybdenum-binding subunit